MIGERVRTLRKKIGWNQEELAERIGVGKPTISQYETEARQPSAEKLHLLAVALNTSADYLLGHTDRPDPLPGGGQESERPPGGEEIREVPPDTSCTNTPAERLRHLRRERGLSQEYLAELLDVSAGAVGNWESGLRHPDHVMLQRLADFFNVSTDYLLGRSEVRNPEQQTPTRIALHRMDGYDKPLPPEAVRSIEEFVEFLRRKYAGKGDDEGHGK